MADPDILAYLEEWQRRPFDWKTHNCGHFVCGWIERARGVRVADDLLGQFNSAFGCRRTLLRAGFRDLFGLAAAKLKGVGNARPCQEHQRGDIVVALLPDGRTEIFGISMAPFVTFASARGLVVTRGAVVCGAWEI